MLAILFSPVIFAAELGMSQSVPEFVTPVFMGQSTANTVHCRDVSQFDNETIYIIPNEASSKTEPNTITRSETLIAGILNHWEAAHRTGIGLDLSPLTANNTQKRDLAALAG